jgi:fido (protein-threonine AMPylation protein)
MHPALAVRQLNGLPKEIVRVLEAAPEGLSQVAIMARLATAPTQSTASRALRRLIDAGVVAKTGATRNAAFSLTPLAARFARPPHLRKPVLYDSQRVADYIPNETRWLLRPATDRMRDAAARAAHQLDASTYSRQIAERFLIDLSWASSALEGNTYGYLETEALIKYGEGASGHDLAEAAMILNHKRAITILLENLEKPDLLSPEGLARLHALLMRDLLATRDLGRVRGEEVRIGGSAYRPTDDHHQLAMDLGSLCRKAAQVEDPFEAAFFLIAGVSYLQPFQDGNKRVGRLSCNIPLLRAGLPPLSFIGVNKADYLTGLIVFYETAELSLLTEVIAEGYAQAAPSYAAALASRRNPRSVELRERHRIETAVRALIKLGLDGSRVDVNAYVEANFAHLSEEERKAVASSLNDTLAALNEHNSIAWNIEPELAGAYAKQREAPIRN